MTKNMKPESLAKKLAVAVLSLSLIVSGFPALAASGTSNVTVSVGLVDKMTVTNGGSITLDNSQADPTVSGLLGPATDTTARLSYIHNKNVNKKITAQATTVPSGTNDIKLDALVGFGGGSYVTLYQAGSAASAQDAVTAIAAGVYPTEVVTYRAQATAAGTPVGSATNFAFTITFTSVDQ
ncbi:MAG: hypothetical protein NTX64_01100 [Elusimicrobia bacterium]|nr:hypothetical protein [Elusimicrobiota bacterium]